MAKKKKANGLTFKQQYELRERFGDGGTPPGLRVDEMFHALLVAEARVHHWMAQREAADAYISQDKPREKAAMQVVWSTAEEVKALGAATKPEGT